MKFLFLISLFLGFFCVMGLAMNLGEPGVNHPTPSWWTEYVATHISAPSSDIVEGNRLNPDQYSRFRRRMAALNIARRRAMAQSPVLRDPQALKVLTRPFHNWNQERFNNDGRPFVFDNPHELNRVVTNWQQDLMAQDAVEQQIFDLARSGHIH